MVVGNRFRLEVAFVLRNTDDGGKRRDVKSKETAAYNGDSGDGIDVSNSHVEFPRPRSRQEKKRLSQAGKGLKTEQRELNGVLNLQPPTLGSRVTDDRKNAVELPFPSTVIMANSSLAG